MERTNVDLHVKILDREVTERAKARGLDIVVYAPHFTRYPEARERASRFTDEELLVVPAREIFTGRFRNRKHLLAVDLSDPIPDFITLEGAMEELRRQDATVLVPHPEFMTVSLDERDVFRYADHIDGIEVYNPKHLEGDNERAEQIARAGEFDMFGSSYAHRLPTVGEVWTEFDRPIETEADLIDALKGGVSRRVLRRSGPTHHLRRAAEFAHLGWENSWQKVDRVLLSGIEPTHPHHIAYDGRFDDVSVY
ncbi:MAG: PHP-associated domain-containing protein [Halodesulfurarchaeum sp.]